MDGRLAGRRILVLEDEYFTASDLRRALGAEGAVIVGPVGDVEAGLRHAEQPLDAAVLDINLEPALSYRVADRLAARGVPYMFLTGYDGWSLPADYRSRPRLTKPFAPGAVIELVERIIGGPAEAGSPA